MDLRNASKELDLVNALCPYTENLTCDPVGAMTVLDTYRSVHGYVAAVLCSLGILGHIAIIVVMSRNSKMHTPVNFLLVAIAIAQMLHLAMYLPMAVYFYILKHLEDKQQFYSFDRFSAVYLKVSSILTVFFHSLAVWLTIAVAAYRWVTVGVRNGSAYSNMRAVRIACVVLIIINMALTIPLWIGYEVYCIDYTDCHYTHEVFWAVGGRPGSQVHFFTYSLLGKAVPSILLTLLTIPLVCFLINHAKSRKKKLNKNMASVEEQKKEKDQRRTTAMLLAVVVIFLCVELPHGIYIIAMKDNADLQYMYNAVGEIIDIVTIIAFSVNFILYTIMSRAFRSTFEKTFCGSLKKTSGFIQMSTALTSLKQTGSHKRSVSSNISAVDAHLKGDARNGGGKFLHPVSQPLLTDATHSTSLYSTNGMQETELND